MMNNHIGYIPAAMAKKLTPRMDSGEQIEVVHAKVICGEVDKRKIYGVRITLETQKERVV